MHDREKREMMTGCVILLLVLGAVGLIWWVSSESNDDHHHHDHDDDIPTPMAVSRASLPSKTKSSIDSVATKATKKSSTDEQVDDAQSAPGN